MSLESPRPAKMHYKCLLCPFVVKSRGHHLEFYHEYELDRFVVRSMIGSDQQEEFFSKYFVEIVAPTTSQRNGIDYNPRMDSNEAIRIRSSKYVNMIRNGKK